MVAVVVWLTLPLADEELWAEEEVVVEGAPTDDAWMALVNVLSLSVHSLLLWWWEDDDGDDEELCFCLC